MTGCRPIVMTWKIRNTWRMKLQKGSIYYPHYAGICPARYPFHHRYEAGGFASMESYTNHSGRRDCRASLACSAQGQCPCLHREASSMELLSAGHSLRKSSNSGAQELEKQKKLDEERWLSRRLRTRTAGAPHVIRCGT